MGTKASILNPVLYILLTSSIYRHSVSQSQSEKWPQSWVGGRKWKVMSQPWQCSLKKVNQYCFYLQIWYLLDLPEIELKCWNTKENPEKFVIMFTFFPYLYLFNLDLMQNTCSAEPLWGCKEKHVIKYWNLQFLLLIYITL